MKMTRKIFAVIMVAAILLSMTAITAFAEGASLTVTGTQLPGKYVDAYRMFTVSWVDNNGNNQIGPLDTVSYTLESAWEGFFTDTLLGSTSGATRSEKAYNYIQNLGGDDSSGLIAFADAAAAYARANASTLASLKSRETAGAGETSVTFDNLTAGYYLVLPQGGSTSASRQTDAMIVNVPSAKASSLNLKSVYPTVNKTVDNNKKETSAQIGETVTFTLTSAVPEMSDYSTYAFNFVDTMSAGLDYIADSAAVTIGGKPARAADYTVSCTNRVLTVAFADLKTAKKMDGENAVNVAADDRIVVTYNAKLNENAVVGGSGNLNQAVVEYSNEPTSTGTGTSIPSTAKVYTYPIEIHKYHDDDSVSSNRLAGAVFELKSVNDANAASIPLKLVSGTTYRVAESTESGTVTSVTTTSSGVININGLKEGTYYLFETAAPTGYNKLSAPITVNIAPGDSGTSVDYSAPQYTVGNSAASASDVVPVENRAGSVLPSTGSFGTIALTVIGAGIVIFGIVITSRKKKKAV